jgi:hypothetical protein
LFPAKTISFQIHVSVLRAFSISAFMASPNSVISVPLPATPAVFESSVLASRFISCKQKIELLAGLAAGCQHVAKMLNMRLHPRNFFGNIAALHQQRTSSSSRCRSPNAVPAPFPSQGRLEPLGQPLLIALFHLRPQFGHALDGKVRKPVQRGMQHRRQRRALALRMVFNDAISGTTCSSTLAVSAALIFFIRSRLSLQHTRHAQNHIQIRLPLQLELLRRS